MNNVTNAEQSSRFQIIDTAKPLNDTRITVDPTTGLQWQTLCFDKRMTWSEAEKACKALRLGGYDDWRLPTVQELLSIVDYGRVSPAIDPVAFPNTPNEWFWTATPYQGNPSELAWFVFFGYGFSSLDHRGSSSRVRAVRGPARQ